MRAKYNRTPLTRPLLGHENWSYLLEICKDKSSFN